MARPPFQPRPGVEGYVRAAYTKGGRLAGFQDASGRFIRREVAANRLIYNPRLGRVEDSLGRGVAPGDLSIPRSGVDWETKNTFQRVITAPSDIASVTIGKNEQVIERFVVTDEKGKISTVEISHGMGKGYNSKRRGGAYRKAVSEAAGVPTDKRLSSRKLNRFVLSREIVIKSIIQK